MCTISFDHEAKGNLVGESSGNNGSGVTVYKGKTNDYDSHKN